VVDQNQLIRQRLSAFLERRPSWEQLIELGILGRQDVPLLAVRDGGFYHGIETIEIEFFLKSFWESIVVTFVHFDLFGNPLW